MGNKKQNVNAGMANAASLQAELAAGAGSDAYKTVAAIFDEGTFVETGALVTRRFSEVPGQGDAELAGAVTGYGAVDGKLTCSFLLDASRHG